MKKCLELLTAMQDTVLTHSSKFSGLSKTNTDEIEIYEEATKDNIQKVENTLEAAALSIKKVKMFMANK